MTGNSDFFMVLYLPMKVLQHIKDKRMHPVSAPNGLMSRFESESIRNYFSSSFDVSTRSRVRYRVLVEGPMSILWGPVGISHTF